MKRWIALLLIMSILVLTLVLVAVFNDHDDGNLGPLQNSTSDTGDDTPVRLPPMPL